MKLWKLLVFSLLLTACSAASASTANSPSSEQESAPSPPSDQEAAPSAEVEQETAPQPADPPPGIEDLGPAPELQNEVWLNTDQPLRLADLRGQVVLIDMWTFG
jgi:hypothetical protein